MHWMKRHRRAVIAAICAGCTALVVLAHFFPSLPFLSAVWRSQQTFEDFLQQEGRKTRTHPDFIFLGLDQSTLQLPPFLPEEIAGNRALQLMTERPFPWSREVWAILLEKLFAAGARVVVFDMLFNPANDGDPAFRAALERYRDRVVLGANFDSANAMQAIVPNESLIPPPQLLDPRVGYVIFFGDALDGKVRSLRFTMSDRQLAGIADEPSEEVFTSLAGRALEKLGAAEKLPRDRQPHRLRFSAPEAYAPRPLYEVFDPKLWRANYADGAAFADKLVMIGASSQVAHDFAVTPMSAQTSGPALHLQAIAAALDGEFVHATGERADLALVCAAGLLAWALVTFVRRPLACVLGLLVITAAYLGLARVAYDRVGLLLLVVPAVATFLSGGTISLSFEYALERMEKLRTRRTLERYVSRNLVKEILDNPDSFYSSQRGVRIPATILFSDIVGFTSLTENADPEALVTQLNEYLSRMTAAVFEHNGTLDKFIGDAVMAVWGNVSSRGPAEDAKACARSALAMRRELRALNDRWHAAGIAPFAIGIGINQGDVLGGNIGSQEKADPTVIGDAVNLASRLESLTRTYGTDILVGESAAALIRDAFVLRSVARVQVKGKSKPSAIFSLIGAVGDEIDPALLRNLETYEGAMTHFRAREFSAAKELFGQCIAAFPKDALARMYLARCEEYEVTPPADSWNGVEVFQKK